MDITGAALLYTLAGLMITFAGFSALLLVIRQAAGAKVSRLDRYLAKTVMSYTFALAAAALLPAILALYGIPEARIWRVAGVAFAAPMLALQASYPHRRRSVVGAFPPPGIFIVFVVLGSLATLALLGAALADLAALPAIYISALTVDFFTVIYGFVSALDIVMLQPLDAPDGRTSPGGL